MKILQAHAHTCPTPHLIHIPKEKGKKFKQRSFEMHCDAYIKIIKTSSEASKSISMVIKDSINRQVQ